MSVYRLLEAFCKSDSRCETDGQHWFLGVFLKDQGGARSVEVNFGGVVTRGKPPMQHPLLHNCCRPGVEWRICSAMTRCPNCLVLWLQVEVKPYVLDDQLCDECQGARCGGKFAPFFCANVTCLQYYCEYCWAAIHSRAGREFHKPLVKEGGDRPRHISFRWN